MPVASGSGRDAGVRRATEESLRRAVPEHDVASDVGGEGWRVALREDIQYLGALLPVPPTALQDTSSHGFPLWGSVSKARAHARVSNVSKGLIWQHRGPDTI